MKPPSASRQTSSKRLRPDACPYAVGDTVEVQLQEPGLEGCAGAAAPPRLATLASPAPRSCWFTACVLSADSDEVALRIDEIDDEDAPKAAGAPTLLLRKNPACRDAARPPRAGGRSRLPGPPARVRTLTQALPSPLSSCLLRQAARSPPRWWTACLWPTSPSGRACRPTARAGAIRFLKPLCPRCAGAPALHAPRRAPPPRVLRPRRGRRGDGQGAGRAGWLVRRAGSRSHRGAGRGRPRRRSALHSPLLSARLLSFLPSPPGGRAS